MPSDEKRQAVAELTALLRSSTALVVTDYRGLKVSEMQSVRRSLRGAGVELRIAKNRLIKLAADDAGRGALKELLEGPTALATIAGDEVALARALAEALRPYSRVVSVRGGLIGDQAVDAAQLARLATLPPRDVLLGRLATGVASPISGLAGALAAIIRGLAGALNAVADQKQQTEGAA